MTVTGGLLGIVALPKTNVAHGITAGDHVLLAIRPEHVGIAPQGLSGTIAAATFLGERSHFHVKIPGRTEPIAVSGQAPAGESVSLEFPPEKLIALPATG